MTRQDRIAALKAAAKERILILDGSWGVMIQRRGLAEEDFRGDRFAGHVGQMKGNNDILCLTRPDIVTDLHNAYYGAGADISETNTFSATTIAQEDYKLDAAAVRDINLAGARLGRAAADAWTAKEPHKPRFVAGSIGPLNKMLSMSSDVNDPGARSVTFDEVYEAYRQQITALNEGGVDLYLIETITDTLNCKACIKAIMDLEAEGLEKLPIWISGTITDRSGRTLSGQTVEAFWNSVRHAKPFAIGFNCALGADLMRPHIPTWRAWPIRWWRPIRMRACRTRWASMTSSRTRPRIPWAPGRRTGSSISSAVAAGRRRSILPPSRRRLKA
jgi:5-methyltetrahydrofolate--homocysteine methyltransferase